MDPKADSGSLASAFVYASTWLEAKATPHGLLCLTMTQA